MKLLNGMKPIDRKPLHGNAPFEEGYFQRIVEKMFLEFTIKILQNQQVRVNSITHPQEDC